MDDQKKKENELSAELAKLISNNTHEQSGHSQPYKCAECGLRVNYTFILPWIKSSGKCPDCWHKEGEND